MNVQMLVRQFVSGRHAKAFYIHFSQTGAHHCTAAPTVTLLFEQYITLLVQIQTSLQTAGLSQGEDDWVLQKHGSKVSNNELLRSICFSLTSAMYLDQVCVNSVSVSDVD